MDSQEKQNYFNTDKVLRIGIWGLGRGSAFYQSAKALNIEVVAGCDFDESLRDYFKQCNPDAYVTDNEDDFLAKDFDAVIVSTYCVAHAKHAIKALKAGKHVLSEVTSFMTLKEGVELVEAVEASGKVYNLAENYPFTKNNMYLAKLYKEGFFGELTYAEYEYVHGGANPSLMYPNGKPMNPGNQLHHWRGWMNYHYYCTHSLGPVMYITGLRPEKIVAFPADVLNLGTVHGKGRKVDGIMPALNAIAPSLIHMSNGSIVRNLMGGASGDSHNQRLIGQKATAQLYPNFTLRVGATGEAYNIDVEPQWEGLGELAEKAGHGGGDFWELYYFARQILTGEKAPWDIYSACDVTLAGIQAMRSASMGGAVLEIPNLRLKDVRDRYRNDDWLQPHIDPKGIFPPDQDISITTDFAPAMLDAFRFFKLVRGSLDAMKIYDYTVPAQKHETIRMVKELRDGLPKIKDAFNRLKVIMDAYPDSMGGTIIREKLELCEYDRIVDVETMTKFLNDWLIKS